MNKNMYDSCVQTAREVCTYELSRYRRNPRDQEVRNYFRSGEFERWFTCSPRTVRMIASKFPPGCPKWLEKRLRCAHEKAKKWPKRCNARATKMNPLARDSSLL